MPFCSYFSSTVNIYQDMHFMKALLGFCVRELYGTFHEIFSIQGYHLIYSTCTAMTPFPGPCIAYLRISPVLTSSKPYHAPFSHRNRKCRLENYRPIRGKPLMLREWLDTLVYLAHFLNF